MPDISEPVYATPATNLVTPVVDARRVTKFNSAAFTIIRKPVDATETCWVDARTALATGDTIASAVISSSNPALVILSATFTTNYIEILLSGGASGVRHAVKAIIQTALGNTHEANFIVMAGALPTGTTEANLLSTTAGYAAAAIAGADVAQQAATSIGDSKEVVEALAVEVSNSETQVRADRITAGVSATTATTKAAEATQARVEAVAARDTAVSASNAAALSAANGSGFYSSLADAEDDIADLAEDASVTIEGDGANDGTYRVIGGELIRQTTATVVSIDGRLIARAPIRIYRSNRPQTMFVDGGGYRVTSPVDLSTYEARIASRTPLRIYRSGRPSVLTLDAGGYRAQASVQIADYEARIASRAPIRLYRSDRPARVTVDAGGYAVPEAVTAADLGVVEKDVIVYEWDEGSGYEADPSVLRPPDSQVHLFLAVGQSYNKGAAGGDLSGAYSTTALYSGMALMLSAGVHPDGTPSAGFVDIVSPDTVDVKEPYIITAVQEMVGRMVAKFGDSPMMVGAIAARGGWNYYRLKRGSTIFQEAERIVKEAHEICVGLGKELKVHLFIGEGESDTSAHTDWQAYSDILQWRQDMTNMVRRHVPTHVEEVDAVFYSTNRGIPSGTVRASPWQVATRKLALDYPHLFCLACPAYAVETTDDSHPSVLGYRELGVYMGRGGFLHFFSTGFRPCDVLRAYFDTDDEIVVEVYVPDGGALVYDDSGDRVGYPASDHPAYIGPDTGDTARDGGWWVRDKTGLFGVESAVVEAGNRIRLSLSRAAHRESTVLMYAVRPQAPDAENDASTAGSSAHMARGVFRGDVEIPITDGDVALYDRLVPQNILFSAA